MLNVVSCIMYLSRFLNEILTCVMKKGIGCYNLCDDSNNLWWDCLWPKNYFVKKVNKEMPN